jgi:hypothetical protein
MESRVIDRTLVESREGGKCLLASECDPAPGLDLLKNPKLCYAISIWKLLDVVNILATFTKQDGVWLEIKPSQDRQLHLIIKAPNGFASVPLGIVDKGVAMSLIVEER